MEPPDAESAAATDGRGGPGRSPGLDTDVASPGGTAGPSAAAAPDPDATLEPQGFLVEVAPGERVHFLDWGGPASGVAAGENRGGPGVLLVHGLRSTAWNWAAVARRVARRRPTVAMDLRGHGLSDSPTGAYPPDGLAEDVVAVAEGSGLLDDPSRRVVLVGHGFGATVAAWGAAALGSRCAALVLVDGGLEDLRESSGMEPDELLRALDEPPEVLRSTAAWLADRAAFDPATWDADAERAARAEVVELPAGRVVPAIRPHALEASVHAMYAYRPAEVLPRVDAPIVVLLAAPDDEGRAAAAVDAAAGALVAAGRRPPVVHRFPADGHNLPRYRPAHLAAAILAVR